MISIIDPFNRGNWAIGLLVLPILVPMLFSFAMVFGYALVYFGQMFVAAAAWASPTTREAGPSGTPSTRSPKGSTRWIWAGLFGLAARRLPGGRLLALLRRYRLVFLTGVVVFDLIVIDARATP